MREAGANYVRMRLWVDPPPGYSDLASDLALARQVSASGMKIYLDIMYSDFWADPTKQNIPAAWAGEDLDQLTATVRSYTKQVISAFAQQGTPVDLVSIGNEIRNGILWPTGEINCTDCGGWASLAQLLKAGVAGAQAGNPAGHRLLIMMHYDQGGSFALSSAFYSPARVLRRAVRRDRAVLLPGAGRAVDLRSARQRGRARGRVRQAHRHRRDPVPVDARERELSGRGQHRGLRLGAEPDRAGLPGHPRRPAVVRHRRAVHPRHRPRRARGGLFYWAPDWIPGVPWEPGTGNGSPNVNMTLFNFGGQALPSIGIFENPAAVCERANPDSAPCVVGG
jgi:arabinogalactan endo-1,4-beta-galactosidase